MELCKNMTVNKVFKKKYGVVDEALPQGQKDSLDVAKYTKSLVKLIKYKDRSLIQISKPRKLGMTSKAVSCLKKKRKQKMKIN